MPEQSKKTRYVWVHGYIKNVQAADSVFYTTTGPATDPIGMTLAALGDHWTHMIVATDSTGYHCAHSTALASDAARWKDPQKNPCSHPLLPEVMHGGLKPGVEFTYCDSLTNGYFGKSGTVYRYPHRLSDCEDPGRIPYYLQNTGQRYPLPGSYGAQSGSFPVDRCFQYYSDTQPIGQAETEVIYSTVYDMLFAATMEEINKDDGDQPGGCGGFAGKYLKRFGYCIARSILTTVWDIVVYGIGGKNGCNIGFNATQGAMNATAQVLNLMYKNDPYDNVNHYRYYDVCTSWCSDTDCDIIPSCYSGVDVSPGGCSTTWDGYKYVCWGSCCRDGHWFPNQLRNDLAPLNNPAPREDDIWNYNRTNGVDHPGVNRGVYDANRRQNGYYRAVDYCVFSCQDTNDPYIHPGGCYESEDPCMIKCGDPWCGDGACNGNETCSSCSQDCGGGGGGGDPDPPLE